METDERIFRDIAEEFRNSPTLYHAQLHLEVQDGIATISGWVSSVGVRKAAERAAKRVSGIKTLVLEIRTAVIPITVGSPSLDTPYAEIL